MGAQRFHPAYQFTQLTKKEAEVISDNDFTQFTKKEAEVISEVVSTLALRLAQFA